MKLTEEKFWDDFWANIQLPIIIDPDYSYDRCLSQILKNNLSELSGNSVLEVGCAPGRWLAYLAKELNMKPSGIDYSEVGIKATLKNFELLGLDSDFIIFGDLFQIKPDRKFDIVLSLGMIAHFKDPDKVIKSHLEWLKPGGTLILLVPNFRGINYIIQKMADSTILDMHNLNVMNLDYFKNQSKLNNLKIKYLGYVGSYEPTLVIQKTQITNLYQFVVKAFIWIAVRLRKTKYLDRFNNPIFSSFILAIYKNNTEA